MKQIGVFPLSRTAIRWLVALAVVMLALFLLPASPVNAAPDPVITINGECCGSDWQVGKTGVTVSFTASGGTSPYRFSSNSSLPAGLTLSSSGTISGTPSEAGDFNVTITVTDSDEDKPITASKSGVLSVAKMDPTIAITAVTSHHPSGTQFMVNFPVSVAVQFTGYSQTDPSESIKVFGGEDNGDPTCIAALNSSGAGICDLVYTTAGSYNISIAYPHDSRNPDDNYNSVSAVLYTNNPVVMQSFAVTPQLSAGRMHTCFMRADGIFSCWGLNDSYDVNGSGNSLLGGPALTFSAGGYHTCWINTNGTVQCWGDNPAIKDYPNSGSRKFISISSGRDFACAIDTRARLYCWGTLPTGLSANPSGTYRAVTAGGWHACALTKSNASPVCWGDNDNGRTSLPGTLTGIKSISAGLTHTCVVTSDSGLSCYGLASGTPPTDHVYKQVQSGSDYSCAQNTTGNLSCWGTGKPAVDTLRVFNGFSSGFLHTCAWIDHSPKPYLSCWGLDNYQQAPRLDLTPSAFSSYSNYIPLGATWTQAFASTGGKTPRTLTLESATVPLTTLSGSTITWHPTAEDVREHDITLTLKENSVGSLLPLELTPVVRSYQLYVENPATTIDTPSMIGSAKAGDQVTVSVHVRDQGTPPISGTVTVQGVDGTRTNTCQSQVTESGTASCNLYFAYAGAAKTITASYAGNGYYTASSSPAATISIEAIAINPLISAGNQFNCSLDNTGNPTCWGKNDANQTQPIESVYNSLSAGDAHGCGRSLNASIYCWGWDGYGLNYPPEGLYFKAVASGSTHACGLTWWGSPWCWGNSADSRTAAPYMYFISLTAGTDHTCGLTNEGTVYCWGVNTSGQTAAPASTFTQISAGGTFTCGIHSDYSLECWGGSDAIRAEPVGSFLSLDSGTSHACAVNTANQVICWGDNSFGKATPPARTFTSVSAGQDHTCGIRQKVTDVLENDVMECWGNNSQGQAPVIAIAPAALANIDADSPANIQISASGGRSGSYNYNLVPGSTLPAGLTLDFSTGMISGTPTVAGAYTFSVRVIENDRIPALIAERTYNLTIRAHVAVEITAIDPPQRMAGKLITLQVRVRETPSVGFATPPAGTVSVQSDDGKSCQAVLTPGTVSSSGSCTIFFTGAGTKAISASYPGAANFLAGSTASPASIEVAAFSQPEQVRTTSTRTYIHQADGSIDCFGSGCAPGNLTGTLTSLSARESLACGLGLNGAVRCREAIQPAETAQAVVDNGPYLTLAVGSAHACALKLDGSVFCWGEDGNNQSSPPAYAFTALSANANQTCGIRSTGTLACWGSGATPPGGNYTALSMGDNHACAINDSGAVVCWGDNSAGQTDAPTGSFKAVSAGSAHSCALNLDGRITCWGENAAGQADAPYGVFTALSAAADHNCAVREGPSVTCWGGNQSAEAPFITVSDLADTELVAEEYWEFAFSPAGGTRPYQGSVSEGDLPQGISMQVNLSPAGVILYGTPEVPDDYPFVLRWEDSPTAARPIPIVLEKSYVLRVTGADLNVKIQGSGGVAMANNLFRFTYTFRTLSALAVPSVHVTVDLPEGIADMTISGLSGCTQVGMRLECDLTELDPAVPQVLAVEGTVSALGGGTLATSAEVQSTLPDWHELTGKGGDNATALQVPVAYRAVVYTDTLDSEPLDERWTGGTITTSPGGETYLGDLYSDSSLRLVIGDLAPHKFVEISFDLYVIGPWLGNNSGDPSNPSLWSFGETSLAPALATSFCNQADCLQAYPGSHPGGEFPAWSSATGIDRLGYDGIADSRYRIRLRLDHTAPTLDLTFIAQHLPPEARWGLDNIEVKIDSGVSMIFLPIMSR